MGKKVVIVGGAAGGASAAARLRRLDEDAEILIIERGDDVSYSTCCLPYFLSRRVADSKRLVLVTPERFRRQYNIEVRTKEEVTAIRRQEKRVRVRRRDGSEYEEPYDVLLLATGGKPIVPAEVAGVEQPHVFTLHDVADAERIEAFIRKPEISRAVVVGGGFAGCETAENLVKAGKKVTMVEAADQVMTPFDFDMAQILTKELLDQGVTLILNDRLTRIEESTVTLSGGGRVPADVVLFALGNAPETKLAADCGLPCGPSGGLMVDRRYRTADESIYAVGDMIEVPLRLTGKKGRLPMAWPAQMEGRAAADAICGLPHRSKGFLGSAVLSLFSLYAASTGLTEKAAQAAGFDATAVYVIPADKVSLMPGSHPLHLKLIFESHTGRILGAQAIGRDAADRRIDVVAALIAMGGTLDDLKETELCYTPAVGTAKDAVHYAALVGLNLMDGRFRQVPVREVRPLVESGAYLIDVREKAEYDAGHLKGAANLPLSELRQRMDEIPRDRPVYLHCRSSQRSYNAIMALQQHGFTNLYNIAGSYLGICLYEYAQDVLTGREKIVTAYNFN